MSRKRCSRSCGDEVEDPIPSSCPGWHECVIQSRNKDERECDGRTPTAKPGRYMQLSARDPRRCRGEGKRGHERRCGCHSPGRSGQGPWSYSAATSTPIVGAVPSSGGG